MLTTDCSNPLKAFLKVRISIIIHVASFFVERQIHLYTVERKRDSRERTFSWQQRLFFQLARSSNHQRPAITVLEDEAERQSVQTSLK